MKNRLTKNWGLKLVSFIFAIALWVIVTNINDPITDYRVSDVPVIIRNADLVTDSGQIYEVLDGTDVIDTVTITAPRSIIDSLDKSNVVAIADMSELSSLNTISIRLSTNKYNDRLQSIKGSIDTVKLNIEAKKTRSLQLKTNVSGEVKEGYLVGDVSTEQNLVRISGPESVISKVSRASVDVDVSGFTSNIGTDSDIRLYDEDGVEIVSGSIEKSISKVRVNIEILEKKTVAINYLVSGEPAEGYRLNGEISSTRNSMVIAGRSRVVQNINTIEIPEGVIDVTGARENVTTLIDLKEYLPDGVILAEDDFTGKVNVTVAVEQEAERNAVMLVRDVKITGVPQGYEAEIVEPEERFTIVLTGLAADLEEINVGSIEAFLDLAAWMEQEAMEEISEGVYTITLDIPMPNENVSLKSDASVRVYIKEI